MDEILEQLKENYGYDTEEYKELEKIARAYEGIGMSIAEIKVEFKNDYNIEL